MKTGTYAHFDTSLGNFTIELFEQQAPNTVANFVKLAGENFYDGAIFHRVIDGFMIQGGDPTGTGRGGPGYTFADEFHAQLKHNSEGILSMANAGPNTNGSQFFITLAPTQHLDGRHTVFGKVTEGLDVVRKIGKTKTSKPGDRPVVDVVMNKVTVEKVI
jgi:cyclophilin family peptidyl-prolyl cis-trans isomerase